MRDNAATPDGNANGTPPTPMESALDWFSRQQSGMADEDEQQAFAVWCAADPAHVEAYNQICDVWRAPALKAALHAHEKAALPGDSSFGKRRWFAGVAAIAATVALIVVSLAEGPGIIIAMRADYRTDIGERQSAQLADGSMMTLNTGSAAGLEFSAHSRRVRLLDGEAYFDVKKDIDHPFEVVAGATTVRVVGTAFSVRRTKENVHVAVERGKVSVIAAGHAEQVILGPGDKVFVADGHLGAVEKSDTDTALAWVDGRLIFRNRPLGEILDELDRYHVGWIKAASERARKIRVSGNYQLTNPVKIARSLADATHLDVINAGGLVIIVR